MQHEHKSSDDADSSDEQLLQKALGMESMRESCSADGTTLCLGEAGEQALDRLLAHDLADDTSQKNDHDNNDVPVVISFLAPESRQKKIMHHDGTDGRIVNQQAEPSEQQQRPPTRTGRLPTMLHLSCDPDYLSEYQCLVRKQIELFETNESDMMVSAQGRNKPIVLGQVGIRCRHCAFVPLSNRGRSAVFFPSKLMNVYQAAQNIATHHLQDSCLSIPPALKKELIGLKDKKSRAHIGKERWAQKAEVLGVYEDVDGLRFQFRLDL